MSTSSAALAAGHSRVGLSVAATDEGLTVHVRASAGSRCTLTVTAGRRSSTFAPITLGKSGRGTIKWTVSSSAPSGTWTISTSCVKRKKIRTGKARIVLVNHGSGSGALVGTKDNEPGGKGGGSESCAAIASPPGAGQVCFIGDPFATYGPEPGEDIGQCTWYAAGMRPDLDGITTGNAGEWLKEASGKKPEGTTPVVGAIAVNTTADGGIGHVAYVAGVENAGATLVLDEANLKYDAKVYLNIETPASDFQGYIYGGPAGNGPGSAPTTPGTPTTPTTPSPAPPTTPEPAPSPPPTFAETPGPGGVATFTDYQDAGGNEGPRIPEYETVQVTCRVEGFEPADHGIPDNWWYKIASSPWNNAYYAYAEPFYNNGQTSGSLIGTPAVDTSVPIC
jgi:surface antigen